MKSLTVTLKVESIRRIESPTDRGGKRRNIAMVEARQIPKDLRSWRRTNLRTPNPKALPVRRMKETLADDAAMFSYLNKGLVIMAESVKINADKSITLVFSNRKLHGLVDGGHTFEALMQYRAEREEDYQPVYVTVEILTGFDTRDEVADVVEARNFATAVRGEAIDNLRGHFVDVAQAIRGTNFEQKIDFSQFETYDDARKPVRVREVLAYLLCFDIVAFGEDQHPHRAYHSKSWVLKHYKSNRRRLRMLTALLPDILALRDTIEAEMPDVYKLVGGPTGGQAKLKSLRGVTEPEKGVDLHFLGTTGKYGVPVAYIFPLLAAFRSQIRKRGDRFYWAENVSPLKVWESRKKRLVQKMAALARDKETPNVFGKDNAVWDALYSVLAGKSSAAKAA